MVYYIIKELTLRDAGALVGSRGQAIGLITPNYCGEWKLWPNW